MKKIRLVLVIGLLGLLVASGCASVWHNKRTIRPKRYRDGIDVVMFAGDVLFTGCIGLIVDFSNGTIYKSQPWCQNLYPMVPPEEVESKGPYYAWVKETREEERNYVEIRDWEDSR